MNKLLYIVIIFIIVLSQTEAKTPPKFDIALSARPTALGNAFTAISDDSSAIVHNPAGLSLPKAKHIGIGGTNFLGVD